MCEDARDFIWSKNEKKEREKERKAALLFDLDMPLFPPFS